MRRLTLLFILISISLLFVWCGDKGTESSEPEVELEPPVQFDFNDYAVIDTSSYYHLISYAHWITQIEPFVDGDSVLGEPFIDVDGNGTYDRGIDIFRRSTDPELNHDLNYNGTYDGPGSRWEPSIPYDDVNGNGQYDFPDDRYSEGEPYCDMNLNGQWDFQTDSAGKGYIAFPQFIDNVSDYGWPIRYFQVPLTHLHITDSNSQYQLPPTSIHPQRAGQIELVWTQSGLCAYIPICVDNREIVLNLFEPGLNDTGQTRVSPIWRRYDGWGRASYRKTTSLGNSLTILDSTYSDLLRIRFDEASTADSTLNQAYKGAYAELYFMAGYGLLSIKTDKLWGYNEYYISGMDFVRIADSMPFPMSQ